MIGITMPLITAGHQLFTIQQVAAGHKLLTFNDYTPFRDIHRFSNGDWLINAYDSFIRMTPDGVIVWAKNYTVGVAQVAMDSDDTFYGVTNRASPATEFRLFKYASDGSIIWGSSIKAQYVNLKQYIYLHGTYVYVSSAPSNGAGYRTDKATGTSVEIVTVFSTVQPVVVGDYVYGLAEYSLNKDANCAFLKYAATGGTPVLSKKLRYSSDTVQLYAKSLRVDPSGTYVYCITGQSNNYGAASKIDLDTGYMVAWVKKKSSPNYGAYYDDAVASDGSYFLVVQNGASGISTVKCDANLNPLWDVRITIGGKYCNRIWALGDKLVHGTTDLRYLLISDMSYNGAFFNRNGVVADYASVPCVGGPQVSPHSDSPVLKTAVVDAGTRSAYANTVSDITKTTSVITV